MRLPILLVALIVALAPIDWANGEGRPEMTVWKSPWCGCCTGWVKHVTASGFTVDVNETEDLEPIKQMAAIPEELQSCHTARVGDYVIEGHVPAGDIERLLAERPDALGLVVPGMPSGSPGMEGGASDPYDVLLLKRDGSTEVFSSYN